MRDFILQEIRRLASANGGQAPGQKLFAKETGIAEHQWRGRFWARWGDALTEAGFQPNDWTGRSDTNAILSGVIAACRHYGRLPTNSEMEMLRRTDPSIPHPKVIQNNFGRRSDMIAALAKHVAADAALYDVAAMLPEQSNDALLRKPSSKPVEGFVYLIKSGDFYKIGRSDDAERRFKQITIALPDKAELFHTIRTDDPPGIEAYWHRRFDDRRANGEWFKLTAQDVEAFRRRKFQ
ncbi:GIY-YIG nuclease family protein [Methylocella sp.]|uniref:GIY-YIG nuclease family protein n=1 Tax=Methylocella sp. TaxID=1978226 RepID=UPI0035B2EDCD